MERHALQPHAEQVEERNMESINSYATAETLASDMTVQTQADQSGAMPWKPIPKQSNERMIDDTSVPLIQYVEVEDSQRPSHPSNPETWQPQEAPLQRPSLSMPQYQKSPQVFMDYLTEIQKHRISREAIRTWANNLRFVTGFPDNTSDEGDPAMIEARDMFSCRCGWKEVEAQLSSEACTCRETASAFGKHSRDYRIVQAPGCRHYIAVSYRWREKSCIPVSQAYGREHATLDTSFGTFEDVVRRSATFARTYGYRLLWIDQECIAQDDPGDMTAGLQAMDVVYERAALCLAVLDCVIETQEQVDMISKAFQQHPNPKEDEDEWRKWIDHLPVNELRNMLKVVEMITKDDYFNRAWTAQENCVAATTTLLIRCNATLCKPSWMGSLSGEVELPICAFRTACVTMYCALDSWVEKEVWYWHRDREADQARRDHYGDYSPSRRGFHTNPFIRFPESKVQFEARLQPQIDLRTSFDNFLKSQWPMRQHGLRLGCTASDAVAILANKASYVVSDRLALMANLCNYNIRLDQKRLEELGYDLAACMFCLALLNGDTTLARLSDKTTYRDTGVADHTMDAVILKLRHPDILDLCLDMKVGPRLFSWAPRLIEPFSETDRNSKDNLRFNIAFLGSPVQLCLYGWLWRWHKSLDCSVLKETFTARFTNDTHSRSLHFTKKWHMSFENKLECFWDIFDLLWSDVELRPLAAELYQTLIMRRDASIADADTQKRTDVDTVNYWLASAERPKISNVSRSDFLESLSSWPEIPIGDIYWLVQSITVEDRVRIFHLQENPGAHDDSDQCVRFAIINTRHVNDVFTPETRYISRSGDEKKLMNLKRYSWSVKVETLVVEPGSKVTGAERPVFQLTVDKLAHKEEAPVPLKGFWTANGSDLPIQPFAML
jgi:hypothetical protein